MERCVGFCVMCLDEQMCKQWLGDSRGCNVTTIGGSTTEAVGSAAGGNATGGTAAPGCVPMYLLPTAVWPPPWSRLGGRSPAGSSGSQSLLPATGPRLPHPTLISLLDDVLVRAPCPVLCCNAKALLREAMSQGWRSPLPQQLRLIDPCVLAWMEAPQLAQRDEKEIEGYSLDTLCPRYGISLQPPQNPTAASGGAATGLPPPPLADGPLARIRRALLAAVKLFEAVRVRVQPWLRPQAVQVEMQVTAVLARMEVLGIAVDAADLSRKAAAVRRRMEALSATASALLGGRPINLGSSVQLAGLLYEELKLPPPVPQGQRDAAAGPGKDRNGRLRTHHSTDEAALKQISHLHPLPALVLQYRSLQNVLSKWLEPEWLPPLLARSGMARAAAFPSASASAICSGAREALPRISCCWNQTATATGRLSSSGPNMQAVTRYEVMVQIEDEDAAVATAGTARGLGMPIAGGATGSAGGGACRKACGCGDDEDTETGQRGGRSMAIVARNAFVAPAGRLLVAADYSQIELRLLAHLSGDLRLQKLLKMGQNGSGGADAFRLIAAAWLRPGTAPADISSRDREQVKRVIYGIIYGMTAQGLAQQLAEYGVGLEEAVALRASFLRHFGGVQAFITSSLHQARRQGYVTTGLLGRRRPIAGVTSTDPRVRAEAERKVVNSIVQGSAADLVKCAMCMWAASNHPDAQQAATLPTCKNRGQAPGRGRGPTTGIGRAQLSTAALIGSHIPGALAARAPAPATPSATGGGTAVPVNIDAELVAQIHDELIFEVDARPEMVRRLVVAVRGIMCHAVVLKVPLLIKVAAGRRWGELQELPAGFGEETS
ncbi:hypothetical protein VaNZ11_009293 [Volvox africanus]|uniref:DNA-directed DNA polymerase family A palm domain-containing protein n=1 Tax=Volvox africanus TaxID=51714 RepID=A0ABQ5S762_9CHLO|nr:hypothetical protein VaNZ11_009293 [Volvox africanus]